MFETAELGQSVTKGEFKEREPGLWKGLLDAQRQHREHGRFPVVIDFAGVRGAGKITTINLLNKWMDARWIRTHAYAETTEEELARPEFWRFWQHLPPRGQIGLTLSGRYSRPLRQFVYGEIDQAEFDRCLDRVAAFERTLADDGALILKFWMHLSRKEQKRRLQSLEKDPLEKWRITSEDWKHWEMYDDFIAAAERLIVRTSTGGAPWYIVEGQNYGHRSLQVGEIIRDGILRQLETSRRNVEAPAATPESPADRLDIVSAQPDGQVRPAPTQHAMTVLDGLDMSRRLAKKEYSRSMKRYRRDLNTLQRNTRRKKISTVLVFEGPDAAGKGGVIRRMTSALDAPTYQIKAVAAPTEEERLHHYLWRFWKYLPRAGDTMIFDRSWYGRVLVERVEEFAVPAEWGRAYAEINDFESQLIEHDVILLKFWIHVSKEEQLARFKAREETPHKRWKLGDEDWRNREKWAQYEIAIHDMVQQTSTAAAPWILVPGNNKLYARTKVIETVCERMAAALRK